eukprot:m.140427 g.140427  ORF g.140427 m.140427 type:complete len:249 (+) comp14947_c1_seq3:408-1154(+)
MWQAWERFSSIQSNAVFSPPSFDDIEGSGEPVPLHISCLKLVETMTASLKRLELWDLFCRVEMPFVFVVAGMEFNGVHVSRDVLMLHREHLESRMRAIEREAARIAGRAILLNSPLQLRELLYDELKIDSLAETKGKIRLTPGQAKSTDEATLTLLSDFHPLPALVLEYRKITKLLSTYMVGLADFLRPDGRVHSDWQQTGLITVFLNSFKYFVFNFQGPRVVGWPRRAPVCRTCRVVTFSLCWSDPV